MADFAVAILSDPDHPQRAELERELLRRTASLARAGESIAIVDASGTQAMQQAGAAAAVMLCASHATAADEAMIACCLQNEIPVFPVVDDLTRFAQLVPQSLSAANGFELRGDEAIGELAGLVLEALGLQRSRRKLFISYARIDAAAIAEQLREAFIGRWYTVFHDTVSIRPGRNFQEELMQQLADSDVMLLLNSPSIAERPYVQEEIAFANQAGVNGVQVVWPKVDPRRDALFTRVDLDQPGRLRPGCRRIPLLSRRGIAAILQAVADGRTQMQEKRESDLVRMVEAYAQGKGWQAVGHLGRFVRLSGGPGQVLDVPFIIGAPTSPELQDPWTSAASKKLPARIIYNRLGLSKRHLNHLDFLAKRFPLDLLEYLDALKWTVIP